MSSANTLNFQQVQDAITSLTAAGASNNTAITTELSEVTRLLTDFQNSLPPQVSQAQLQTALDSLASLSTQIVTSTKTLQDSAASILAGDPLPVATPPVVTPTA